MSPRPDAPPVVAPAGYGTAGLVLADERGVAMLRGAVNPASVLVTETPADWLSTTSRHAGERDGPAVLAVIAGTASWNAEIASRVPNAAKVYLRTNEAHTPDILRSLPNRRLFRREQQEKMPDAA